MTFKELRRKYSISSQQQQEEQSSLNAARLSLLISTKLRGKPFWFSEDKIYIKQNTKGLMDLAASSINSPLLNLIGLNHALISNRRSSIY